VIRKEAWPSYRTISGVRLCWELEEPKGPKGLWAFRRLSTPSAFWAISGAGSVLSLDRNKATLKRGFKLPWREAGTPKTSVHPDP
jgi:hypothetical protein